MGREATDKELSGGIVCDGLGSSFAAVFGVLPNTSFSQNVGLVTMTKIVNRFALACGVAYMLSGYFGLYSSQKILYSKLRTEFINIHAK